MMDLDDLMPTKKAQGLLTGESLASLSIAELDERIRTLEAEIARVREEIKRKTDHNAAAAAIFKS